MKRHRGDPQREFGEFVAGATDYLIRTAYLMTWDSREAEDLVQETLVRLSRHWPRVVRMTNVRAYARKILVNLVIDGTESRKRRHHEMAWDESALEQRTDNTSTMALKEVDARLQLRAMLASLPIRQRTVIVLRYWEDMSESDVAELLGCPVGTVKSTASRALVQLREILSDAKTSELSFACSSSWLSPKEAEK